MDDIRWREREYSPSSAIGGNYGPHIARYMRESARAAALPALRDLRYGVAPRALIDYFPAKHSQGNSGLLVFLHGGYWQELSKNESTFLAPTWHDAGLAHAVVGYTLAPAATLAEIVDECVAAIVWLKNQAQRLGFDAENIVVAGSSAGAYLAAACASRVSLRGMVLLSGIYNVSPLIGTSINGQLGLDVKSANSLNLLRSSSTFAPAVVTWGEIETSEFKRQSNAFANVLQSREIACIRFEIAERNHFDIVHELADSSSQLYQRAHQLFKLQE